MTELTKYNHYYFQNMKAFMEDDELEGLLSTRWNGDFKSQLRFREEEILATLTFKNVKVIIF